MGGYAFGVQSAQQDLARNFQRQEEQRVSARNAQAAVLENALNNPDANPEDRKAILAQHAALFQPHEAPDLFARLSRLIHGQQQKAAAGATAQPTSSAAPVAPQIAPTYTNELGDTVAHSTDDTGAVTPPSSLPTDSLGIPISDPNVAVGHSAPLHPMATSHPVLDRLHEGLAALGNHLKGFAQPVAPAQVDPNAADVVARNYQSPVAVQRKTAELTAEHAQDLADVKGGYGLAGAKIRQGGTSDQARYDRAFASELGKEVGELTPAELAQSHRENSEAKRRPQVIIDPTSGIANIISQDEDGKPVAHELRDSEGKVFGGFKPNTVTIRNGVYHFIGADNKYHEVPVTTVNTKIFGPHAKAVEGDAPITLPKADPKAIPTEITQPVSNAAPAAPDSTAPPKGKARPGAAIKAPISTKAPVAPTDGTYPGKIIGDAKLPASNLKVVTTTEPVLKQVDHLISKIDELGIRGNNTPGYLFKDRVKYGLGMASPEGSLGSEIANLQLGDIVEAASALNGSSKSLVALKLALKHTPTVAIDSPMLMREKLATIKSRLQDLVDEARTGAFKPSGQPASSAAPKPPGSTQSLADRLNEALGASK